MWSCVCPPLPRPLALPLAHPLPFRVCQVLRQTSGGCSQHVCHVVVHRGRCCYLGANVGHWSLSSTSCHIRRLPGNLRLPPPVATCHLWLVFPLSLALSSHSPYFSYFILISSLLYGANIKSTALLLLLHRVLLFSCQSIYRQDLDI